MVLEVAICTFGVNSWVNSGSIGCYCRGFYATTTIRGDHHICYTKLQKEQMNHYYTKGFHHLFNLSVYLTQDLDMVLLYNVVSQRTWEILKLVITKASTFVQIFFTSEEIKSKLYCYVIRYLRIQFGCLGRFIVVLNFLGCFLFFPVDHKAILALRIKINFCLIRKLRTFFID